MAWTKALVAAAAIITLTACARGHWHKPGASAAQTSRDIAECDYDAEKATASQLSWVTAVSNQISLREKCMRVRGYTVVYGNQSAGSQDKPLPAAAGDEAQCLFREGFVRFMPPLYCERAGGKPHIGP